MKVANSAVRERVLQLLPYPFIWIKFGSIWEGVFQTKARNLLEERADHFATTGDAVVQEREDMTPKMMENPAEECRDFISVDVVPEERSDKPRRCRRGLTEIREIPEMRSLAKW